MILVPETVITPEPYPGTTTTITGPATKKPLSPGKWEGDFWVQEDGYRVHRKWVEKYPALFGPCRQDPDGGQGDIECDDAIAKLLAKFTGYGGTFSNWMERHAFIIFAGIGYNDVESKDDVPPIPDFFLTEMAYCYTGLSMGRGAKKVGDAEQGKQQAQSALETLQTWTGLITANPDVTKKVASIAVSALAAGGIILPPVIQAILKAVGIG